MHLNGCQRESGNCCDAKSDASLMQCRHFEVSHDECSDRPTSAVQSDKPDEVEAFTSSLNFANNGHRVVSQGHETTSDNIKHRLLQSACLCCCMLAVGLMSALAGTTLVHISLLYDTTPGRVSWSLMLEGVGLLLGTFVCRPLVDRVSVELVWSTCIVAASLFTLIAPYTPSLLLFIGALSLRGMAFGCFLLISQTFVVAAWSGHRYREPLNQTQQAVWSVGATVSAFIIRPFLVEVQTNSETLHHSPFSNGSTQQNSSDFLTIYTWNNASVIDIVNDGVTTAAANIMLEGLQSTRLAFLVIGSLSAVISLPTIWLFLYKQFRPRRDQSPPNALTRPNDCRKEKALLSDNDNNNRPLAPPCATSSPTTTKPSRLLAVSYVAVVVLLNLFYGGFELTSRAFLTPFLIRHLLWPVADAALQASVFFAAFTAGRLLGIPLSTIIRPAAMLVLDIILVSVGLCLLMLAKNYGSWVVWISTGMIAVGLSTGFPNLVLISAAGPEVQLIGGSGSSSSQATASLLQAMMIGGHLGGCIFPVAAGYLFDNVTPMWVVYLPLILAVAISLLMIVKQILAKLILQPGH